MSKTMNYTSELVVVECWCGMPHAVPASLRDFQLRQHHDGKQVTSIFCPLGHGHAPASEPKVKRLERELANTQENLRIERAAHSATKGAALKARRRAARGVCPCCNRSFVNVARHIANQHPEHLEETR